jgi:hypothetical protein
LRYRRYSASAIRQLEGSGIVVAGQGFGGKKFEGMVVRFTENRDVTLQS